MPPDGVVAYPPKQARIRRGPRGFDFARLDDFYRMRKTLSYLGKDVCSNNIRIDVNIAIGYRNYRK